MTYRIGNGRYDDDRCECYAKAVCKRWEKVAHGPGGGIDIVWGVVPSCQDCAIKTFESFKPFAHILPPGKVFEDSHHAPDDAEVKTSDAYAKKLALLGEQRRDQFRPEKLLVTARNELERIRQENLCSDWRCRYCGSEIRGQHVGDECYDRAWCDGQALLS